MVVLVVAAVVGSSGSSNRGSSRKRSHQKKGNLTHVVLHRYIFSGKTQIGFGNTRLDDHFF